TDARQRRDGALGGHIHAVERRTADAYRARHRRLRADPDRRFPAAPARRRLGSRPGHGRRGLGWRPKTAPLSRNPLRRLPRPICRTEVRPTAAKRYTGLSAELLAAPGYDVDPLAAGGARGEGALPAFGGDGVQRDVVGARFEAQPRGQDAF